MSFIKIAIVTIGTFILMFSCTSQTTQNPVELSSVSEKYYYEGTVYTIKMDSHGNYIQDNDFNFIANIFENPNVGIAVSKYDSIHYLYTNEEQSSKVCEIVRQVYAKAENWDSKKLAKRQHNASGIRVYQHQHGDGYCLENQFTAYDLRDYLMPNGQDWDNRPSSFIITGCDPGLQYRFWEFGWYQGRSITFTAGESGQIVEEDLRDDCRTKFLGICTGSWNDVIGSYNHIN
jgi:hypothetical protein